MTRRVYRGRCPYEDIFEIELEGDCRNCEHFDKCKMLEGRRRRRARRRMNRIKAWSVLIGIALIILLIITLIIMLITNAIKANAKPKVVSSDTTLVVVTEKEELIQVDVDVTIQQKDMPETILKMDETSYATVNSQSEIQILPYISAYGPGEAYYYELSYEDKVYIAMVVYAEARGEIFEGKVAVAAAVLNRYVSNDERFDRRSIYSVITQSGQFASIKKITQNDLDEIPSCMEAVEAACKGWDPTRIHFENGAKFFFNPDGEMSAVARKEREGIDTYRIGNHLFHNDFND